MRWSSALVASLLFGALSAQSVLAADAQGNLAARGLGSQPCQPYLDAISSSNVETLRLYVAWIDGALSASNRLTADTFDVSPFIAPGAFAGLVVNACRRNPQALFDTAVAAVVQGLAPARVQRSSPLVQMQVGDAVTALREETLRALQARLRELRLMRIAPTGAFGEQTREGLRQFQEQQGLPQTGLPDPETVLRLLVVRPAAAPAAAPAPAPAAAPAARRPAPAQR